MKLAKNYLSGSKFINELYGEDLSFDGVDLQEVSFGWNGPIAKLRFSMKDFPLAPPRKWEGLNAVQVELSAFPLSVQHPLLGEITSAHRPTPVYPPPTRAVVDQPPPLWCPTGAKKPTGVGFFVGVD